MLALLYNCSTPVACRWMNMKAHQTLVWLNLLSLGTKDLAESTIGIQSGLCHGWGLARTASQKRSTTTLLRHFVCITPACPLSTVPAVTELSAVPYVQPPPPPYRPDLEPSRTGPPSFPCRTSPAGSEQILRSSHTLTYTTQALIQIQSCICINVVPKRFSTHNICL
jgi:hypothetical protein